MHHDRLNTHFVCMQHSRALEIPIVERVRAQRRGWQLAACSGATCISLRCPPPCHPVSVPHTGRNVGRAATHFTSKHYCHWFRRPKGLSWGHRLQSCASSLRVACGLLGSLRLPWRHHCLCGRMLPTSRCLGEGAWNIIPQVLTRVFSRHVNATAITTARPPGSQNQSHQASCVAACPACCTRCPKGG